MNIYSDKLAQIQVIINCRYSVAQMCTRKDTLAHILSVPYFDDVMSYNLLTTNCKKSILHDFTLDGNKFIEIFFTLLPLVKHKEYYTKNC